MTTLKQTPSQTVGPYFAYGLTPEQYGYAFRSLFTPQLVRPDTPGEHITLAGRVFDGQGNPVNDAMVEILQADAAGQLIESSEQREKGRGFRGFGRAGTGADGSYAFATIKPDSTGADSAPHIAAIVTMRGLLNHAFTRIYFDDERQANARDAVLGSVSPERRDTLIARREALPGGVVYRFDIRMQGPQETVFFDL